MVDKMSNRKKVVIIGGGLSGLSCGLRLSDYADVVILEAKDQAGGLAASVKVGNKWIPITYHHVMSVDHVTQRFLKEFGLYDEVYWKNIQIAYYFHEKCYLMSSPKHLLQFRALSLTERVRMGILGVECVLRKNWNELNDKPADRWIQSRVGKRVKDLIFERLSEMKFGMPLKYVSAGWLGSRLGESARNREDFGYPRSGIKHFLDLIVEKFASKGKLLLNTPVKEIKPNSVETEDGKEFRYDYLVSTIPPPLLLGIQKLADNLDEEIHAIKYVPMICSVFGSNTLITPHYWNVYMEPKLSFGGIFHHTSLYPEGGVDGEYVYYTFTYLHDENDPMWLKDEEECKYIHVNDIKKLNPSFKEEWWHTFKIKYSMPLFSVGYQCPPVRSGIIPNLFYAGVYRKFPQTRTMHTALESGEETASEILGLINNQA